MKEPEEKPEESSLLSNMKEPEEKPEESSLGLFEEKSSLEVPITNEFMDVPITDDLPLPPPPGSAPPPDSILSTYKKRMDLSGLSSAIVEAREKEFGLNELPTVEVSLWHILFVQFTGLMPYMLEIACILALAVQDWIDFAIIFLIILCNAIVGFTEELKAKKALENLTSGMEHFVTVRRNNRSISINTRQLVPDDIIHLEGGKAVPADVEWLEGDVLSVDTAAVTGENIPRKYPNSEHGIILAGCAIVSGEAYLRVMRTGIRTEMGKGNAAILRDKVVKKVSVFEQGILKILHILIIVSIVDVIIIFLIQGFARKMFYNEQSIQELVLTCISIIIASIPVALPLVLQVTMALGINLWCQFWTTFAILVILAIFFTNFANFLESDKTGTLTTAKMSIDDSMILAFGEFNKDDVLVFGALASNRTKKEDPIDRAILKQFDKRFGEAPEMNVPPDVQSKGPLQVELWKEVQIENYFDDKARLYFEDKAFTFSSSVGFNAIYKRVLFTYDHPNWGETTIAKGLAVKILNTADGMVDDAADQWIVQDYDTLKERVNCIDEEYSQMGFKTVAVAIHRQHIDGLDAVGRRNFQFVGILPMIDPPRHDTKQTIRFLQEAGIKLKMITGDHQNIAKTTALSIGLNNDIQRGDVIRFPVLNEKEVEVDEATLVIPDEVSNIIYQADGFAQVLPQDKRIIVLALKRRIDDATTMPLVIGMTGDGANDAPALSLAQCGVAVHGATDAAKHAAAIILTKEGLSPIYTAVIQSRKIFRKLKAYATYRFAATIHIVTYLTLLIYSSNCSINSLFIILLALCNDITMLPIAYDNQQASRNPETPQLGHMFTLSLIYGFLGAGFSLLWVYCAEISGIFKSDFTLNIDTCPISLQAGSWVQLTVATEILIFSSRAPSFILTSLPPSATLIWSVFIGCVVISILAVNGPTSGPNSFGGIAASDVVIIWVYDLICLFILDFVKVCYFQLTSQHDSTIKPTPEEQELVEIPTKDVDDPKRGISILQERQKLYSLARSERLLESLHRKGISFYESPSNMHILVTLPSDSSIVAEAEEEAKRGEKEELIDISRRNSFYKGFSGMSGSLAPATPVGAMMALKHNKDH